MKTPRGFAFSGLNAGIKAARKDLALVWSDAPCNAAGVFTVNKCRAAAVEDAAARLPASDIRGIVINSGNANALTGPAGARDVRALQEQLAQVLEVDPGTILVASTGVLGVRLPIKKLLAAAKPLVQGLGPHVETAAEAIMTTDTRVKLAHRKIVLGGRDVSVSAFGKGSGMVAPSLATVLAFIVTDAAVPQPLLVACLATAVDESFHNLVIDGEMSTNDGVFVLANGLAHNPPMVAGGADHAAFQRALTEVCVELARAVAEDGEGATKLLEVRLTGAPDRGMAKDLAKSVVGSVLVKAAMFGTDPNWGRILAAVGARAGARGYLIDPMAAKVAIQGTRVFDHGEPVLQDLVALRARMRQPQIRIDIELAGGTEEATVWGCDLSYDYVKINADYISFTSASPDGVVTRDDRLTNYSPSFKRSLLVEALSYISRFSNKRAVIKYGGAAMIKDSLKASFAADMNLLRSAGLLAVVVHGGGGEIAATVRALGGTSGPVVDGVHVTSADDLKVVEMVLSGKINSEIVSLLNQQNARAVGLSGKDAGFLRCRKRLDGGRDLGMVGEITHVDRELLDVLLSKQYVPVVSPIGLGEDGEGYHLDPDAAAAEIAITLKADKLLYLADATGLAEEGELVTEISASALRRRIERGTVETSLLPIFTAGLRALDAGVESVHVIDGRSPHSLIAELFTDRGVGTLIVRD